MGIIKLYQSFVTLECCSLSRSPILQRGQLSLFVLESVSEIVGNSLKKTNTPTLYKRPSVPQVPLLQRHTEAPESSHVGLCETIYVLACQPFCFPLQVSNRGSKHWICREPRGVLWVGPQLASPSPWVSFCHLPSRFTPLHSCFSLCHVPQP